MKTVLVLAALVAFAYGSILPSHYQYKTKDVDAVFVERQKKILALFYNIKQVDESAEYFKLGNKYDIEANIDKYEHKKIVEDFLTLYRTGFQPKGFPFLIFYDRQREEAIALFELFFYAKDFDTFYQTASWARIYLNQGQFLYSYYIAVLQRPDANNYLLPAPYEVYPELFMNMGQVHEIARVKQQGEIQMPGLAAKHGIVKENQDYIFYANYSDSLTYPNQEQRLAYFTEDIGLNAYYYYFHSQLPFWWNADKYGTFKERRGEIYFYYYQQLLARYYLERLSNGLGEIPSFSWFSPVRVGYYPKMSSWYTPFAQRSNYYLVHNEKNFEAVRFLDIFEKTFFQYLQKGHFKAFDQEVDFTDPKAINFVGNYWQTNADLYTEDFTKVYQRSYEITARQVLGGAPAPFNKYSFMPSALDFYQTSLRDPAFYQLYNKIFDYMVQYKNYLKPYEHDDLHYVGVKINDVKVDKMETFFDLYDFEATNAVFFNKQDSKPYPAHFKVRQPRLNHKTFTVTLDVKADIATDAIFKIWIGPKYDSNGFPIAIENNWMNFVELDWFTYKLTPGANKIERNSEDFFYFKEDSLPMYKVWNMLEENKIPEYMSEKFDYMPKRLMLPKGTKGGFPYQIFVFAFPNNTTHKELRSEHKFDLLLKKKALGFPFDRPVKAQYFKQPNMFFEDVLVYHAGEDFAYKYATPEYKQHKEF